MQDTDEALMAAYRDGDAAAFDVLYMRHKGPLFRYVLRGVRSGNRSVAEELYQEIWIKVIEARARYAPTARFTTWIYAIAHNRLIDYWRRHELAEATPPEEEPPAGPEADPARQAESRQTLGRVAQALAGLPHAQREAFLLHEEAAMSVREIAAATQSDPEAVKSRLRYAFAKLKEAAGHG
jgi:RNA polymerase sigma-70 factor (ECF subfamily)